MKRMMGLIVLAAILMLALAGCGGGGGGQTSAQASAVVKLSTRTAASSPTIGGISVSLNLPAGVTAKVREDGSGQTADGVVVKSGAADSPNTVVIARYDAAAGTIHILVVKSDGFPPGEFVTVTCDLTGAVTPAVGDFTASDLSASDLTGNDISGLEVSHTLELK